MHPGDDVDCTLHENDFIFPSSMRTKISGEKQTNVSFSHNSVFRSNTEKQLPLSVSLNPELDKSD